MSTLQNADGFVLIHGGGVETWVWNRVIPKLEFPAVAAHRIPSGANWKTLTLDQCVAFVERQAADAGLDKIIVVAHSVGGVIARELAVRAPERVAGCVFLAANVPTAGKTSLSMLPFVQRIQFALGAALARRRLTPTRALKKWMADKLCHDLDEAATRQMLEHGTHHEPSSLFFKPVSKRPIPQMPLTYIKLTRDRVLHPAVQDRMAANIGARVLSIESGHTVMLSRPDELADALNRIAGDVFQHRIS